MEQYIPKSALMAEFNRLIAELVEEGEDTMFEQGRISAFEDAKLFLDTLEVKNSTHRTPADIEAAMQEVEDKSEVYTNAHRGERDDDVLSQMRGEPVSEDLDEAGKEWIRPQLDKSYEKYGENKMMELTHFDGYAMLEAIEFGMKLQREQMMEQAIDGVARPDDCEVWCNLDSLNLKDGDKVKIVIVKSE